jgi:hypothetical protein
MTIEGGSRPAPQSPAVSRQQGAVWLGVGLATVAHVLRSRPFHVRVLIVVIGLGALVRITRANQAAARARLATWGKAARRA